MIVPRSTIHKQKREFFTLVLVLSCLPPPFSTFHKTMLKFLKSSGKRYSGGTRRSSGSQNNWKKWHSYIGLSMRLRRQRGKQRRRPRRKLRGRELQRRRKEKREQQSTSSNSEMRCQRKMLSYWRGLKDPRLWGPNARRSPPEIRRDNGPPRRLGGSNWGNTMEVPHVVATTRYNVQ